MAKPHSTKAPAFQFYPTDFLSDPNVIVMTAEEVGVYWLLICACWLDGELPNDKTYLAKLAKLSDEKFAVVWPSVERCFRETSTGFTHKRLDRERVKQREHRKSRQRNGIAGAKKRWLSHSQAIPENGKAIVENASSSLSSSSSSTSVKREEIAAVPRPSFSSPSRDPFTDPKVTERAARFIDRYQEFYPKHRHGARYAVKPARDYSAAVTLCETWSDDGRLDKLAVCFLTTDHKFAAEGSRTIPQFLALASWCDGELAEWERRQVRA